MFTKSLFTLVACVAAFALAGCGDSEPDSANVNGSWTIAASGDAPKATWKITSSCDSGPCDFSADMGMGQTVKFTYSNGEYVNENSASTDGSKGKVTVSTKSVFKPTAAEGDNVTAADVTATTSVTGGGAAGEGSVPEVTQKATRDSD